MNPTMLYSPTGLKLTQSFESCRLVPYQDDGGVWTDGWGNTHGVTPHGPAITQKKADDDLAINVGSAVHTVNFFVHIDLKQNEFDALVDFVFNVGSGNFTGSTLLRKLNMHDMVGAAHEFERWDMDNGKHVAGLLRRRKAEEAMWNLGGS